MSWPPKTYVIGDGPPSVAPPSKVAKDIIDAILKVRRATVCVVCGGAKEPGRWFDKTCYFCVPPLVRSSLWSSHHQSDREMRDTFLEAVDHLVKHAQRFVPRQKLPAEAQQIIEETGFSPALTQYLFERGRA
jgi:hypothetical protein